MKSIFHLLILFLLTSSLIAQPTPGQLSSAFEWRNIGPANQGGRIVDIEADPNDFTKVVIATGSGGVWKSDNAGTSWTPIFDRYETASIGDIALGPNGTQTIWVGTGEANNRNSTSWGNGVYRSDDGGQNFRHLGLANTQAIARVVTHPKQAEEVCVCATGHLWGYEGERGIFQTTDGGKSWKKLAGGLPDDGKTGCTDLVRDPKNPKILYAAMYHRYRQPWTFYSGGEQGGIYKSTDNGKSWKKLSTGLPAGPTGRIGLAIYPQNPKILMALVEAERSTDLNQPGSGLYRTENGGQSWQYVNTYNNRPFYYSQVRINPRNDQRVYLLTTSFMVSDDGGKTLRNGSEDQEVHGDFHALWPDPNYPDRYYLGADKGLSITHDHGTHFTLIDNLPIGQFYRIGYDMRDPYYVYGGLQDNGTYATASFSRDARGILSDSNWKLHWGDGQFIWVDPDDWRKVYSSTENGSFLQYDPLTHRIDGISPTPLNTLNPPGVDPADESAIRFNWSAPLVLSPHDANVLYGGGNYLYRSGDRGQSWKVISPDLSTNHPEKRLQGKSGGVTPDNTGAETHCSISTISISLVKAPVVWVGTDDGQVHVTQNDGESWTNVRTNIPDVPAEIWVSRIEASHTDPAVAYVTFDGHRSDHFHPWVFRTADYGASWQNISNNLPETEVVRVIREDLENPDLLFIGTETGIWFSIDRGGHWERFMPGLPTVSIYDLKIHARDHDLIAGTHGRSIWIMDDISALQQMRPEVMEADAHLFDQKPATLWENVSRGGQRGHFWFAGDNPPSIELTSSKARARFRNTALITYYLGTEASQDVQLEISDLYGKHHHKVKLESIPGIHRYQWDLSFEPQPYSSAQQERISELFRKLEEQYPGNTYVRRAQTRYQNADNAEEAREAVNYLYSSYLEYPLDEDLRLPEAGPGIYQLKLTVGDQTYLGSLEIREDPLLKE
ncbi:sialidase family protein [Flavilitoribacter nigricans]|uniref:Sortilin N-terminal domain-containing protein n=1 Tax=Flavilitoribacter nigricans (strain ATCC 23147 / DSM 23189 / NBRC 102662 / NCIMB 1420 / SS-2) TaxID=1122177 RepID=A0A2D0NGX8_FLAN2|nr:sialidase family protein [Flavilitoribacter nigricans]PHN07737.1 hypothetical protein CRP01_04900 [Flavilitoribacter nigricans DSM 23189 = NBRC 102662]